MFHILINFREEIHGVVGDHVCVCVVCVCVCAHVGVCALKAEVYRKEDADGCI